MYNGVKDNNAWLFARCFAEEINKQCAKCLTPMHAFCSLDLLLGDVCVAVKYT